MAGDPFGRALRDHYHGDREAPLVQRDGPQSREHPVEQFYFRAFPGEGDDLQRAWLASWLDGPLLDAGAGVGRHALYFQEQFETVAIEVSESLVETMTDRGVADAREADMFDLTAAFERDRFRSVLAYGTQVGLAGSMGGLRRFLGDLAFVTTPDATAVLDCYDPDAQGATEMLGYRADPTPGLASRVMAFEYEGDRGRPLLFRLFSPDRLREATLGTGWTVAETKRDLTDNDVHYLAALAKE